MHAGAVEENGLHAVGCESNSMISAGIEWWLSKHKGCYAVRILERVKVTTLGEHSSQVTVRAVVTVNVQGIQFLRRCQLERI